MSDRKTKVVIVGSPSVGKSCFLNTFKNDEGSTQEFLRTVRTTVGTGIFPKTINVDKTDVRFEIWDTSGEEKMCNKLFSNYYRGAHAVIVMYDVTCRRSYREVNFWATQAKDMSGNDDVMLTLVGNKIDRGAKREVRPEDGRMLAKKLGMAFYEASSLDKLSVDHILFSIAKKYVAGKRTGTFDVEKMDTDQSFKLSRTNTAKEQKVPWYKRC